MGSTKTTVLPEKQMNAGLKAKLSALATAVRKALGGLGKASAGSAASATSAVAAAAATKLWPLMPSPRVVLTLALAVGSAWWLVKHPPVQTVAPGDMAVRTNQLTGGTAEFRDGTVWVWPGLHALRSLSLRDQLYRPTQGQDAEGKAPFQSVEGLSLGVDLTVRFALDPSRVGQMARSLPTDIAKEVVEPAVQGVIYKAFTRYTVREIFSAKRAEIQQTIEAELKGKLAADGILLRGVQIGKIDLPAEYKQGMDRLLAEELASEKMQYTLALKEKQVRQTELEAQADKARRETAASAAAREQIIAAQAQEEAMRHVLPFKQKQIEQRQFEAEAEKQARIKTAEGSAQARRIEAAGEADSRQKLADAEAYRMDRVGRMNGEQMAREGALIARYPLLIQKTIADKLSDKIQVIIAPPGTDGKFIAAGLIGGGATSTGTEPAPQAKPEMEGGQ
jgi:regulator of protease activity HflC (stomatin/prohibitin superfamily)